MHVCAVLSPTPLNQRAPTTYDFVFPEKKIRYFFLQPLYMNRRNWKVCELHSYCWIQTAETEEEVSRLAVVHFINRKKTILYCSSRWPWSDWEGREWTLALRVSLRRQPSCRTSTTSTSWGCTGLSWTQMIMSCWYVVCCVMCHVSMLYGMLCVVLICCVSCWYVLCHVVCHVGMLCIMLAYCVSCCMCLPYTYLLLSQVYVRFCHLLHISLNINKAFSLTS